MSNTTFHKGDRVRWTANGHQYTGQVTEEVTADGLVHVRDDAWGAPWALNPKGRGGNRQGPVTLLEDA